MRIIFMGTPDIAAHALEALIQTKHDIVAVYTQADKPVGRKQILTPPPVKQVALAHNIEVVQPKTLKDENALETFKAFKPDIAVVVAYGRILPADFLNTPPHGCINLHVSLLPQYRGAAPIQWAVINGEIETGVSIMQLDEGLDTGPLYAVEKIPINPEQTAGELFEAVTEVGCKVLTKTIDSIQNGTATLTAQQGTPSLAPPLRKAMAEINFEQPAIAAFNLIRGCNPWPMAWFTYQGKRIKVLKATLLEDFARPGEIINTKPLTVSFARGSLILEQVVPEGSRPMSGTEWAAGKRFVVGEMLLGV